MPKHVERFQVGDRLTKAISVNIEAQVLGCSKANTATVKINKE